jgi:hypothetical protein
MTLAAAIDNSICPFDGMPSPFFDNSRFRCSIYASSGSASSSSSSPASGLPIEQHNSQKYILDLDLDLADIH